MSRCWSAGVVASTPTVEFQTSAGLSTDVA